MPGRLTFDHEALRRFLSVAIPGFSGDLTIAKFSGGQSNPTYRVDTAQGPLVLRRKPPGTTLASAHAVDREVEVMRALGGVDFPVPRIFAECADEAVIGSPFYVMEYLDGRIFWDPLLPEQTPQERRDIYFALTDAWAALHAVNVDAAGLSGFGPRGNYYGRQIEWWVKQYRIVSDHPVAGMEELATWLAGNIPADDHLCVVHGDFRLDNVVFHKTESEVIGVIDWELATLGNPMADLSYFLLAWIVPLSLSGQASLAQADLGPLGIPGSEEIVDRYFAQSRLVRPKSFHFHHAYNLFRLAAILHGISARSRAGNASSAKAQQMSGLVEPAVRLARKLAGIA